MKIRSGIAVLSLVIANLISIAPEASAAVSSNGLFLHLDAASYSGTGTWNDLSGSSNNGTPQNSPTLNANTGKFLQFNGSNQYVSFGNLTTSFTSGFSATFFANFGTAQNYERVFDFGTGTGNNNILVARSGTSTDFSFELYGAGNTLGACNGTGMISDNQWAHYAVTIDGTNCKLYKNGQLFRSSAYSGLPTAVTRTLNYLGKSNWGSDGYFDTGIGEISMYNRGLTASEVLQNFKAEADICSTTMTSSGNTRFVQITTANKCLWTIPSGVSSITYFIVGGGGGGGGANSGSLGGGGGGGGGGITTSTLSVTPNASLVLNVGAGGAAGAASTDGGGGTASWIDNYSTQYVAQGGSGGQGSPGISNQDNLSGDGGGSPAYSGGLNVWDGGGGGGGAGGIGSAGTDIGGQGGNGGAGGIGVANSSLTNVATYFAAGGGGGGTPSNNVAAASQTDGFGGLGGSSVGGNGGVVSATKGVATAGAANTGSGGGGGGWNYNYSATQRAGGAGANGVIFIKFTLAANSISSINVTSSSGADSLYTNGEVITVTVVWSDTVTVTGSPRIPIQGLSSKYLTFESGSESNATTFTYTVVSPDLDTDGFSISADSLALNGGSIKDTAGLDLTITHSQISASLSFAIDGRTIGSVTSISFSSAPTFRTTVTITANVSIAGKVLFKANNVRIPNCIKRATSGSSPITATCVWKPSKRGTNVVSATISPTNGAYSSGSLNSTVNVLNRSGTR